MYGPTRMLSAGIVSDAPAGNLSMPRRRAVEDFSWRFPRFMMELKDSARALSGFVTTTLMDWGGPSSCSRALNGNEP